MSRLEPVVFGRLVSGAVNSQLNVVGLAAKELSELLPIKIRNEVNPPDILPPLRLLVTEVLPWPALDFDLLVYDLLDLLLPERDAILDLDVGRIYLLVVLEEPSFAILSHALVELDRSEEHT